MNSTLVFLHLSRIATHSPFLSVTNMNSRYTVKMARVNRLMAPLIGGSGSAFSVLLSKSMFTQSQGPVYLEHTMYTTRHAVQDDLHVYDCIFQQIMSGGSGGAIYVSSDTALVTMDRVTFVHCASQADGGALWLHSEQSDMQHVRMIDCEAHNANGFVIQTSQDCNVDCSTVIADSETKAVDHAFVVKAVHAKFTNFNISKVKASCEITAGKSIHVVYSTFQECVASDYVLSMMPTEHEEMSSLLQFSNVLGNRASHAIVRVEGDENILHMVAFIRTAGNYYLLSNEQVILEYCAFDVPVDFAIEPETNFISVGTQWNEPDEEPHDLWVGDESDYGTLQPSVSETYVPSMAKSLYVSHTGFYWHETVTYMRSFTKFAPPTATQTATATATNTATSAHQDSNEGSKILVGIGIPIALLVIAGLVAVAVYSIRRLTQGDGSNAYEEEPIDDTALLA